MLPVSMIVAPTDFSDEAQNGVRTAAELAKHFSAALRLVHVVTPMPLIPSAGAPTGFHVATVLNELQQMARNTLDELIEKDLPSDVTVEPEILIGEPGLEIVRFSEENGADVIVMATHGQTGWRRFVSGSVAEKVIRHASLPVLSIRSREAPNGEW